MKKKILNDPHASLWKDRKAKKERETKIYVIPRNIPWYEMLYYSLALWSFL